MKTKKIIVPVLLIVLVFFFSCKKGVDPNNACTTSTEYLSTDITQLKLKKSSYWVFIDSVSMTTDSMYLDSVLYYGMYPFNTSCPTKTYQGYGFRIISSTDTS